MTYFEIIRDVVVFAPRLTEQGISARFGLVRGGRLSIARLLKRISLRSCLILSIGRHSEFSFRLIRTVSKGWKSSRQEVKGVGEGKAAFSLPQRSGHRHFALASFHFGPDDIYIVTTMMFI